MRGCLRGVAPKVTASDKALKNGGGKGCGPRSQAQAGGHGDRSSEEPRDLGPGGDESCFLFPPLGKRVGKADPKVAGVGTWLQRGNGPQGQTWSSQKRRDRKRASVAQKSMSEGCVCACVCASSSQGLLWPRSRHPRLGLKALTQHQVAVAIIPPL